MLQDSGANSMWGLQGSHYTTAIGTIAIPTTRLPLHSLTIFSVFQFAAVINTPSFCFILLPCFHCFYINRVSHTSASCSSLCVTCLSKCILLPLRAPAQPRLHCILFSLGTVYLFISTSHNVNLQVRWHEEMDQGWLGLSRRTGSGTERSMSIFT